MSSRLDPLARNYYRRNNYRQTAGYPKREWTTEEMNLILVHSIPGTAADDACIATLTAANLHPFRVADWLAGLAPARLAVPLEELLTFFQKGLNAPQDTEE